MNENEALILSDVQIDFLLDLLFHHKKSFVQEFLKAKGLSFSYTILVLKQKIKALIDSGVIQPTELVDLLDSIEEHGNQHIYLYKCNKNYLESLSDEEYILNRLEENNIFDIYNRSKVLWIPDSPTLSSITHTDTVLRYKWVENRVWYELLNRTIVGDELIKIYKIHHSRGIRTFRVDLVNGNTEFTIQRLPKGPQKYRDIRDLYFTKLNALLDISAFSAVALTNAIGQVEGSGEVERRHTALNTITGAQIVLKSRGKGIDYQEDPNCARARGVLDQNVSGSLGSFYWRPNHVIANPLHVKIYGSDNRVGIFGEWKEEEVNHVLSRIRFYAS